MSVLIALTQSITKCYMKYNVSIRLSVLTCSMNSVLYKVCINPGTTISSLKSRTEDVKISLGIPYFVIDQQGNDIILSVSTTNNRFITLDDMLHEKGIEAVTENLLYPIALGKDIFGKLIYEDLADLKHIAYTGSTGSGKSVACSALL